LVEVYSLPILLTVLTQPNTRITTFDKSAEYLACTNPYRRPISNI
jgi:hypothetical protein